MMYMLTIYNDNMDIELIWLKLYMQVDDALRSTKRGRLKNLSEV